MIPFCEPHLLISQLQKMTILGELPEWLGMFPGYPNTSLKACPGTCPFSLPSPQRGEHRNTQCLSLFVCLFRSLRACHTLLPHHPGCHYLSFCYPAPLSWLARGSIHWSKPNVPRARASLTYACIDASNTQFSAGSTAPHDLSLHHLPLVTSGSIY